jgi:biotin transport system ATP-binding protein
MNIIEVRNLSHRAVDGKLILANIDLAIKPAEFVVVAGANGSGKSTLFKHLNGLLLPSEGDVLIDGVAVEDDFRRARKMVGMIFQDADSQIVGETVFDDAAFGPENLGVPLDEVREIVTRTLELVGLSHLKDMAPHLLSGGEKRRLAIAGVLTMKPKILVFDEPFSNLDYPGIKQVLLQMATLHRSGHTIVVSTHNLETVFGLADRMILMQAGKIVKDGCFKDLLSSVEEFGIRMPEAIRLGKKVQPWLAQ